jgi:glutamyl-tRNA synthetase
MELWLQELETLDAFTALNIEERFKLFLEKTGLGIGAVLPLFRLLITGTGAGPSMFEIGEFLGKEECLSRMNQGIDAVETLKK